MKIYYREKSGGIEILRCLGIESRVEIPEMIQSLNLLMLVHIFIKKQQYELWLICFHQRKALNLKQ